MNAVAMTPTQRPDVPPRALPNIRFSGPVCFFLACDPVRFVDQKEPEPENYHSLLVGNRPEPIKRQDFWFWFILVHKSNAAIVSERADVVMRKISIKRRFLRALPLVHARIEVSA